MTVVYCTVIIIYKLYSFIQCDLQMERVRICQPPPPPSNEHRETGGKMPSYYSHLINVFGSLRGQLVRDQGHRRPIAFMMILKPNLPINK